MEKNNTLFWITKLLERTGVFTEWATPDKRLF